MQHEMHQQRNGSGGATNGINTGGELDLENGLGTTQPLSRDHVQ